jgi:hypothetical protein
MLSGAKHLWYRLAAAQYSEIIRDSSLRSE